MRLNYSKVRFAMAFPFQKQEAFFEGHNQAFHFFGGIPRRINSVCDRVLLSGYLGAKHEFGREDVDGLKARGVI